MKNHSRSTRALTTLLTVIALSACAPEPDPVAPGERIATAVSRESAANVPVADQRELTRAQLSLGFSLGAAALPAERNAMISPWSIHTALTMAHLGARGATAEGLGSVLRTTAMGERALDAYNAVDQALRARRTHGVILRSANAVFAPRGLTFEQPFVDGLAAHFPVGLSVLDFAARPEESRLAINAWVSAVTEEKIPELFGAGVIHRDTRLVLVNATYFYGPWKNAFEAANTRPSSFVLRDGTTVQLPKMNRVLSARAAMADGWRAIEIPYANESLSMVVIVPSSGDVASFERALEEGRWTDVTRGLEGLSPSQLQLSLPKFRFTHQAQLASRLAEMGAGAAFSSDADFSGISTSSPMRIERVVHSTFVAVDEKGTEAAAATGITFGPTSIAPLRQFDVDRPFVFVIRDVPTGAPLFIGHVVDPRVG